MKERVVKLATMGLSASMVMGTAVPVLAANNEITDTRTFTISAKTDDTHSYDVYQILKGDLAGTEADGSDSGNKLSNIKAGQNYKGNTDEASVNAAVKDIVDTAKTSTTDSQKLAAIEKYVDLGSAPIKSVTKDSPATVAPGYYLIKDKAAGSVGDYDAYTLYIVKVAGNTTIERKVAVPTVEKKVKETNDTTGAVSDWQGHGDYDIGDVIPFQLTGTIAANYDEYQTYKYSFNDTLSAGLTRCAKDGVKVSIDGTDVTSKFTISDVANGKFTVSCDDLKALTNEDGSKLVNKDSKVVVEYTATLNTTANGTVLGSAGNPNTVTLTFSNNPNTDQEGSTSETPEKEVKVYSYQLIVNKTDKDKKALEGAGFTLYKKDSKGTFNKVGDEVKGATGKDGKKNLFKWEGLDAGTYKLSETTTPNGYNTIKDITFDVDSSFTGDELTGLVAANVADKDQAMGTSALTGSVTAGSLTGDVVNIGGTVLPTTGSTGLIVLVGGAALVLGASGIVRMRKKEEA